jgi:hypothetical protein
MTRRSVPAVLARDNAHRERSLMAERNAIARENDRLWRLLSDTFDAWVDGIQPTGRLYRTVNETLDRAPTATLAPMESPE